MNELVTFQRTSLPRLVTVAGDHAELRFIEFFATQIRNTHTRRAYVRAVSDFLAWCDRAGVASVAAVQPLHVAAYIEQLLTSPVEKLGGPLAAPSVKQSLAAIRHMYDWLVTGHVVKTNPAASVRGPRHSVRGGKTSVLSPDEAARLLDSIDVSTPIGLRDRALIALMVYTFARIGAVVTMKVEDVYTQGRRLWVLLHEKGGKEHKMPCHHNLETYLHEYLEQTGLGANPKAPLFPTIERKGRGRGVGRLSKTPLPQSNAYAMIGRRAARAAIMTKTGNHTFRATGITTFLKNGGSLENAQAMANHASTRTTQLYDRRQDEFTLDEIERIVLK
jgi:site-specific recombinase XerD